MEEKELEKVLKVSRWELEQQLNLFIGSIKVSGLSKECKVALVKLKIELGKFAKEIEEYRKATIDGVIKPEGYDELKSKVSENKATKEEEDKFNELEKAYNQELMEILVPYFNEVVEIPFEGIKEDDFWSIVENSDVEIIFGYEYLKNKLVK